MTSSALRAILEALALSQRQLARTLGVDERTVRRWCSGAYPVPPDVAAWLDAVLATRPSQQSRKRDSAVLDTLRHL